MESYKVSLLSGAESQGLLSVPGIHTDGRHPESTMMREIRIFQKLVFLPLMEAQAEQLRFTGEEQVVWSELCKTQASSEVESELDEEELSAWYNLSQGSSTGQGDELPKSVLLNPIKTRRNNGLYRFAAPENLSLFQLMAKFLHDARDSELVRKHPRVPLEFMKFKRVKFCGVTFGSQAWGQGKDMHIVARFSLTPAGSAGETARTKTLLRPGRILYFIQVDWIVSHAHAIELEVVSCRYAVCRWYDLRENADSITDTL
jgi:hypothetical protein